MKQQFKYRIKREQTCVMVSFLNSVNWKSYITDKPKYKHSSKYLLNENNIAFYKNLVRFMKRLETYYFAFKSKYFSPTSY